MYYHRSYGVLGLELLIADSSLEAIAIVASNPCSLSILLLHPNTCSNNLSFKIQPTIQEHEELIWPMGNLKLELTKYSR